MDPEFFSMDPEFFSMDPELEESNSCFLFRLLDNAPRFSDWEQITKWNVLKTSLKSFSNRIQAMDRDIEVLVKAKEIALQSREILQTEITQREAERNMLELTLMKAIAFKKMSDIDVLKEEKQKLQLSVEEQKWSTNEILQFWRELTVLRDDKQKLGSLVEERGRSKIDMKGQHLAKNNQLLRDALHKVKERHRIMSHQFARMNNQEGQPQPKEVHQLEVDKLRSEVVQVQEAIEGILKVGQVPTAVQTQENQQAGNVSLNANGLNVAPDVSVKQQGSKETVSGQEGRKRDRATLSASEQKKAEGVGAGGSISKQS